MDAYASNETRNHTKRLKRSSNYSDLNQALWDWFTACRNPNIPVSRSMLQEETMDSWKQQLGGTHAMFGTWMRRVAFGVASQRKFKP